MAFKKLPTVVIFGRANVGKSTLFNTLTEKQRALTSKIAGTTRDVNIHAASWGKGKFSLVDTGGILELESLLSRKSRLNEIEAKVQSQARLFLKRADLILFMVDTRDGLLPPDKQLARFLQTETKGKKTILLVANKADTPRLRGETHIFNALGLGEPIPVSATTGSGTGDLLDQVVARLPDAEQSGDNETDNNAIKIAIIGKPNVGKSSLLNAILGEERVIVSPIPHTTRDPQDTDIAFTNQRITLIDTAGIGKKDQRSVRRQKDKNTLKRFSIQKSLKVLRSADIILLVVDISEDISHQEAKLTEEVIKAGKSLVIVANKWDLIKEKDTKAYTEMIHRHLPFAIWAPIIFVSALSGTRINKLMPLIIEVMANRLTQLNEKQLDKFLKFIVKKHPPVRGRASVRPFIRKIEQVAIDPPTFSVRIGTKEDLDQTYLRFIENRLRDKFGYLGTPIKIYVARRKKIHGRHEEGELKKK